MFGEWRSPAGLAVVELEGPRRAGGRVCVSVFFQTWRLEGWKKMEEGDLDPP